MKVDKEKLEKVAHLARLKIKPEEETKLIKDMSEILTWVEKLNELDTEGVEPLTHMTEEVNVLREDSHETSINKGQALKNAPATQDGHFKVPRVLKHNS